MKTFIDCGSHFGQGLINIASQYNMNANEWDVYTFEANPTAYSELLNRSSYALEYLKVKHHNKAVYTYDGEIEVLLETPDDGYSTGCSTSVVQDENWKPWEVINKKEHYEKKCKVECVDLSNFIKQFKNTELLVLKLDVEGAEYDILEKMIKDETIDMVNHLFVEFHARLFSNSEEVLIRENVIKNILNEKKIKFVEWE